MKSVDDVAGHAKGRGGLLNAIGKLFPKSARSWLNFSLRMNDSSQLARILQDGVHVGKRASELADHVGKWDDDYLSHILLNEGQIPRAYYRFKNLIKNEIEPLTGTKSGDTSVPGRGVTQNDISAYVQIQHFRTLAAKMPERAAQGNLPTPSMWVTDEAGEQVLRPISSASRNTDGSLKTTVQILDEIEATMRRELGGVNGPAYKRVIKGAEAIKHAYAVDREMLTKAGFFTREFADKLGDPLDGYEWYNPTIYAEYLGRETPGDSIFAAAMNEPLHAFSDDAMSLGALPALDPDVMMRHFAQTEFRVQRNTASKALHSMLNEKHFGDTSKPLNWLTEVTDLFETTLRDGTIRRDSLSKHFDINAKKGFLVFYDNGKRRRAK